MSGWSKPPPNYSLLPPVLKPSAFFLRKRYFPVTVDLISWLTYYAFDCFNRYIQSIEAIFSQAQQWADTPKASPVWCPGKRLPFFTSHTQLRSKI